MRGSKTGAATARPRAIGGFTLVEAVVVLAILGILAGTAIPLLGDVVDRRREQRAEHALEALQRGLEAYYEDHAAFPETLDAPDFVGVYVQPGIDGSAIRDPFAPEAALFRYVRLGADPDRVGLFSLGRDRRDDGLELEELQVTVHGAVPGWRRTQLRVRLLVECLAAHLAAGGRFVAGPVQPQLAALESRCFLDGFGTPLRCDGRTLVVQSAGPDRRFDTEDDRTW